MPIYVHSCASCGTVSEDYLAIAAPRPVHCGVEMQRLPQPAGSAHLSKNGAWFGHSMPGKQWIGGGRPKPRTIGKGHGVGGRRPPPSIKKHLAETKAKP